MGIAYIVIVLVIEFVISLRIITVKKNNEDNINKRIYELEWMKKIVIITSIFIVIIGILIGIAQFGLNDFIDEVIEVIRIKTGRKIFDGTQYQTEGHVLYNLTWKYTEIERICTTIIGGAILGIVEYIIIQKSISSNNILKKL